MTQPLLSIVTAVRNRIGTIDRAIDSVPRALVESGDVEHVVVDGASDDGTLDRLTSYAHLRVMSEPDQGVYDAMNKGIDAARGRYVGFLNSDDVYVADGLRAVAAIAAGRAPSMISGGAVIVDADGHVLATHAGQTVEELALPVITRGTPVINARFIRADLLRNIGSFDQRYRTAADRDLLLRLYELGVRSTAIGRLVYEYRSHPGSLTFRPGAAQRFREEHMLMIGRHLADQSLPREVHAECRLWQSVEVARGIRDKMQGGMWGQAVAMGVSALRSDPTWPVRILQTLGGPRSQSVRSRP